MKPFALTVRETNVVPTFNCRRASIACPVVPTFMVGQTYYLYEGKHRLPKNRRL